MRSLHLAALMLVAIASTSTAARAAPPRDAVAAEELFRRAKELLANGDIQRACASFSESHRLDPAAGTLLNWADCEEREGKLASAWQHFVDARAALAPDDYRVAFADKRIAALEPRLPRLTVTLDGGGAAPGARVFRDAVELGAPSLGVALPTDPGRHVIVMRAPGRADATVVVMLDEKEQKSIVVEPGPPSAERAVPADADADADATDSTRGTARRTIGYVVGGAGALGLALGTVAGFITLDAASRYEKNCRAGVCTPQGLDAASTGKTFEVVSPIALAAGAAALAAGIYLVVSAPKTKDGAAIAVPVLTAGGAAIVLENSF